MHDNSVCIGLLGAARMNATGLSKFRFNSGMMTSSNGSIFRFTGPLWGEFTSHRWIPPTKASEAEIWCFLWSAPEQTVEQTMERLAICDAIAPIMTSM